MRVRGGDERSGKSAASVERREVRRRVGRRWAGRRMLGGGGAEELEPDRQTAREINGRGHGQWEDEDERESQRKVCRPPGEEWWSESTDEMGEKRRKGKEGTKREREGGRTVCIVGLFLEVWDFEDEFRADQFGGPTFEHLIVDLEVGRWSV
jgi:hypothetical protein